MTRKIRLGAFLPGGGQHVASWRHPDQPADGATSFEFHKQLAQTAERGLFDAYFLADNLAIGFGGAREGGNARVAGFEPVTLFSALAPFTTNLGFIATAWSSSARLRAVKAANSRSPAIAPPWRNPGPPPKPFAKRSFNKRYRYSNPSNRP